MTDTFFPNMVNSAYTQKFVFVPSPQPDFHQLVGGLGMRLEFLVDFFPRKHLYIHTHDITPVFLILDILSL